MKKYVFLIFLGLIKLGILSAQTDTTSISEKSLEDLMNIQVTSVSKKAENLQNVPFALYVITSSDIEKSAYTSLVDLLREKVPGYWAASMDYRKNDTYVRNSYSGSVLVLLDGTPMQDLMLSAFSDANFDIPLSSIDRIEVIRGSGGVVYGANSASGVISIFTKNANSDSPLRVDVKAGAPTFTNVSFQAGKKYSDRFSFNTYGQFNYFGGYKQMDVFNHTTSVVPNSLDGSNTTITNRFPRDDDKTSYLSLGLNSQWNATEKLTLSTNLHLNATYANAYNVSYPIKGSSLFPYGNSFLPMATDTAFLVNDNKSRFVGNVKLAYNFSDKHNLFFRISTNYENQHLTPGGGYDTKNGIVDFEVQDNFELPFNTVSVGANYRILNYDIDGFFDPTLIQYVKPQNTEHLKGGFIQDKLSLLDEKLNFYLGLKAENFSLINSNYYFSPMAKLVVKPMDKFTLWGGFSRSYTTPGYNQTNVELNIFRMATFDPASYPGQYSITAINSPNTKPTSMSTWEAGLRIQATEKLYFETNFYKTDIADGVVNSPAGSPFRHIASRVVPGRYVDAYYYGNYMKGTNTGLETVVKALPSQGFELELSHTWYVTELEYQANSDFDINVLPAADKKINDKSYPTVPTNVYRGSVSIDLPFDFKLSVSGVFTSAYYNRFGTVSSPYEYDSQRFDPLFSDRLLLYKDKNVFGKNESRTIVNFKLDKYLLDKKLDLYIYGTDVTNNGFVESVNQFYTAYPRQVSRMIGGGVSYRF